MATNKTFPIIETGRFTLRQFTDDDLGNVYQGLSHPDVIRYYGVSFDSLEATKEQMEWFKDLEAEEKGIWWAIVSKDRQIFYGAGGLNSLDKANHKAEIGFWLLPEYWGQGIMKEAMPRICDYAFTRLGLHRIEGFVDSQNKNCKNGLAKLDFHYEGTMRDCEHKNGEYISIDIYACINSRS
jgi:ribosomal-protein-alanine N-acetyltransferase